MGSGAPKGHAHSASRPFDSPLRLALQKREQFVGWLELALTEARWHNRFDGFQLFSRIGPDVDLRRGQVTVSQPQGYFPECLSSLAARSWRRCGEASGATLVCRSRLSIFERLLRYDAAERTRLPIG